MKTAFLINGFRLNRTTAHSDYALLRSMLQSKGYEIARVDLTWNYRTVSRFAADFAKIYEAQKTEHNIVIGNSFGAMTAFVSASKLKPDKLMICSLSGFFKEDLHKYDKSYLLSRFGKRRLNDLRTLSADDIAEKISQNEIETIFLYGEKEKSLHPHLMERVRDSVNNVKSSRLLEIPRAGHRMYEPDYVEGIKRAIGGF